MREAERLAALEARVEALASESAAARDSLSILIATSLHTHDAALTRLSAAYDRRGSIWLGWVGALLLLLVGAGAWIMTHQVEVIIRP